MRHGLIFFIFLFLFSCKDYCDSVKNVKDKEIHGIVKKKYILDWNHGSPELDISTGDSNNNSHIFLIHELSGFWKYVEVGDSIIKERDSFKVKIVRDSIVEYRTLNYGCK